MPPVTFEEIDHVILGRGDDVFDGGEGTGFVQVVTGNGTDSLFASRDSFQNTLRGEGFMRIDGATATIDGTGGADRFLIFGVGDAGEGPPRS